MSRRCTAREHNRYQKTNARLPVWACLFAFACVGTSAHAIELLSMEPYLSSSYNAIRGYDWPAISLGSRVKGDAVQWSRDGRHVRCRTSLSNGASSAERRVGTVDGIIVKPWETDGIEWAEAGVEPELPDFLSRDMPVVSPIMPIVWGRDSSALYVADSEGVWRVTLAEPFMPLWDLIYTVERANALAVSPSGGHLVVEVGAGDEREIHELRLGEDGVSGRVVGVGRGATFGPTHDVYYFGSSAGWYGVPAGGRPRELAPTDHNSSGY
jgi:hypothetical protein